MKFGLYIIQILTNGCNRSNSPQNGPFLFLACAPCMCISLTNYCLSSDGFQELAAECNFPLKWEAKRENICGVLPISANDLCCIGLASSPSTQEHTMRQRLGSSQSDGSLTGDPAKVHPPTVSFEILSRFPTWQTAQQKNCSTLDWHFFAHIWKQRFHLKADVATWCCSHIKIKILQHASTIRCLIELAGTKSCCMCIAEPMIHGKN